MKAANNRCDMDIDLVDFDEIHLKVASLNDIQ